VVNYDLSKLFETDSQHLVLKRLSLEISDTTGQWGISSQTAALMGRNFHSN